MFCGGGGGGGGCGGGGCSPIWAIAVTRLAVISVWRAICEERALWLDAFSVKIWSSLAIKAAIMSSMAGLSVFGGMLSGSNESTKCCRLI